MTEPSLPNVPNREAAVVLRKAASKIDKHGWIQGWHGDELHGFCVIGALDNSVDYELAAVSWEISYKFRDWLNGLGIKVGSVVDWNDQEGQTKEEVVLYMRKFADELDPGLQ